MTTNSYLEKIEKKKGSKIPPTNDFLFCLFLYVRGL